MFGVVSSFSFPSTKNRRKKCEMNDRLAKEMMLMGQIEFFLAFFFLFFFLYPWIFFFKKKPPHSDIITLLFDITSFHPPTRRYKSLNLLTRSDKDIFVWLTSKNCSITSYPALCKGRNQLIGADGIYWAAKPF